MAGLSLTQEERVALTFIAHNDPKDGFVRRTWLEFKTAICGLLQRTRTSGWISADERLPEVDQNVLAAVAGEVGIAHRYVDGWFWDVDEWSRPFTPTHWMPLPEPPEAK